MSVFKKLCLGMLSSVCAAGFLASPAQAVIFNESALEQCYQQVPIYVPIAQIRTTISTELHFCEEVNHFSAIFVGDLIEPGQTASIGFRGNYWRGNLSLSQQTNGAGHTEVLASGWAQHLVLDGPGQVFRFDDLTGGGTGNPTTETNAFENAVFAHDGETDFFTAHFQLHEAPALFNISAGSSSSTTRRGWKVEIEGSHGPGPFIFSNAPIPLPTPIPAAGVLMFSGLFGLAALGRLRRRSKKPA